MSEVHVQRTKDRVSFTKRFLEKIRVSRNVKRVLIKPNIVSFERYPTTTHPEVLETVIKYFSNSRFEVIVADGPASDAGDTKTIIENHYLKKVCDKFDVPLLDLNNEEMVKIGNGLELEVSTVPFKCDFIVSLPVLKSHGLCDISGALKNQFGFFSAAERRMLHSNRKDIHMAIAEVNRIIKPDVFIVDAVRTLIGGNEVRWGGRERELGHMLAGDDPVSLDVYGFKLMQQIDPKLKRKSPEDVLHLKHAISLKAGQTNFK